MSLRRWLKADWDRTLATSAFVRAFKTCLAFRLRHLTPNDWGYLRATIVWSIVLCEGIVLISWIASEIIFHSDLANPWGGLKEIAFYSQLAIVSSIVTGLLRRSSLEKGSANSLVDGALSYFVNLCLFVILLAFLGLALSAVAPSGSEVSLGSAIIGTLIGVPILISYAMTGSLLVSPILIPAILASQAYMTDAAQRYPRGANA